jgi:hypothetical protein
VNKDAALDEHRAALATITQAATTAPGPHVAAGSLDWMLYDWLMAHRESPDSGAIQIHKEHAGADASMILGAAAAAVACRGRFDPGLFEVVATFASAAPS